MKHLKDTRKVRSRLGMNHATTQSRSRHDWRWVMPRLVLGHSTTGAGSCHDRRWVMPRRALGHATTGAGSWHGPEWVWARGGAVRAGLEGRAGPFRPVLERPSGGNRGSALAIRPACGRRGVSWEDRTGTAAQPGSERGPPPRTPAWSRLGGVWRVQTGCQTGVPRRQGALGRAPPRLRASGCGRSGRGGSSRPGH